MSEVMKAQSVFPPFTKWERFLYENRFGKIVYDRFFTDGIPLAQRYYFNDLNDRIKQTREKIIIIGYDKPYMNHSGTIGSFRDTLRRNSGLGINAIVPEGETILDRLAEEWKGRVEILRTPFSIVNGYIILDSAIAVWDSRRKTNYKPERKQREEGEKCVRWRQFDNDLVRAKTLKYHFWALQREVEAMNEGGRVPPLLYPVN